MNEALQMKLLWKIYAEPDNIWVKLIKEKYLQDSSIRDKPNQATSWQFGRLLSLRDKFEKGLHWIIGDGNLINIWNEICIPNINLKTFMGNNDPNMKVCHLFTP